MTHLSPQKLDDCLKLFLAHAKAWTLALKDGDVPITEEEPKGLTSSGMFGLRT